jgi:hypothetical protein
MMTVLHALWAPPAIESQPSVRLVRWQIFELPDGSRHFCGYHAGPSVHEGRVSSAIERFSPDTMTGITRSGRSYRLEGPPGEDEDAEYVKRAWLRHNGVDPADARPVGPDPVGRPLN